MSSHFLKNNFTYTDSNDLHPLQGSNRNFRNHSSQNIQNGGSQGRQIPDGIDERRRKDNYSITPEIVPGGPVFVPPPGQLGLSPFCGTFYDQKFSGNHLEGIHIEPVLAIDSKARNHSKYPNPNFYDLQLNTTYKDVSKVELKFALIPNSGYVINKANNLFYFQDRREQVNQCKYYQVEIPCGDWPAENAEGPSIASILEAELNFASQNYGHRKDCNVSSSVPYYGCICNCSTSVKPAFPLKSREKLHDPKFKKQQQLQQHNPLALKKGSVRTKELVFFKGKKSKVDVETEEIEETDSCCPSENDNTCDNTSESCCDDYDPASKYSVTFCRYRRKFTITQISGSGLFNIIFCGGLTKVGEQGTVTHPIMGVDRFLSPEIPVNEFQKTYIARSIGPVLGFCPRNLQDCLSYTSDGVINFDRDRYIILRMPQFERLQSNWDPLQGAFAIIAATRIANDFVFAKWDNDPYNSETYTKYFNPPLPNLSKIRIEFYNSCGEPFDFNGLDHLLLFDIHSLTQQTVFPIIPGPVDQC